MHHQQPDQIPTLIAKAPWINLFSKTYLTKSGQKKEWIFASRDKNPPHHCNTPEVDAIIIVALLGDKLVMTAEYRVPIGGYELGFPAGLVEAGETPEVAAIREFFQETGLKLKVERVSPKCFSSAGLTNESVRFVIGTATGEPSNKNTEDSEDILIHLLSEQEVKNLIQEENPLGCVGISAKAYLLLDMVSF